MFEKSPSLRETKKYLNFRSLPPAMIFRILKRSIFSPKITPPSRLLVYLLLQSPHTAVSHEVILISGHSYMLYLKSVFPLFISYTSKDTDHNGYAENSPSEQSGNHSCTTPCG